MIINGGSRNGWRYFAAHFEKPENEIVRLADVRGLAGHDVTEAFREIDTLGSGVNGKNTFYHANMNPEAGEHLTDAEWDKAIDLLEEKLGLEGQPRFAVEHVKKGRTHRHIIWSRVDPDTLTLISDSHNFKAHTEAARAIEKQFGLNAAPDILIAGEERPERRPKSWEKLRGGTVGLDVEKITAEVSDLRRGADSGKAFAAALEDAGYTLCKGDRRDFVIIDPAGHEHSLGRRVKGMKAPELREFMADIDREALPSVAGAREALPDKESRKEDIDLKRFDLFMAPIEKVFRETGEAPPLHGMAEATWWERAAGIIGRTAERVIEIAGAGLEGVKGLWRDLLDGRGGGGDKGMER